MKQVFIFLAGTVLGVGAGVLGSKAYFKKKYEKQYDEDIRKYYLEFCKENTEEVLEKDEKPEEKAESPKSEPEPKKEETVRFGYDSIVANYQSEPVDYFKIAKERHVQNMEAGKVKVDPAEQESPSDDDSCEEVSDYDYDELVDQDFQNGISPINADAWASATPHYEKHEVTFYPGDNVFFDEYIQEVIIPDETCGVSVVYRFGEYTKDEAYARNFNESIDYCVHRSLAKFDERE